MWWEYWGWRTGHGGPRPTKFVPSYYLNPKSWEHVKQIRKRAKQTKKNVKQIRKKRKVYRLTPTVMNMRNGRYEHVHRPLWTRASTVVRWLSQCFRPNLSLFSPNNPLNFKQLHHCFQNIMPLSSVKQKRRQSMVCRAYWKKAVQSIYCIEPPGIINLIQPIKLFLTN